MKFEKIKIKGSKEYYWTWRDVHFMPYAWLYKKDIKNLPKPFFLEDIHPDCNIGFKRKENEYLTNIIELPNNFEKINIDKDLRKDLRRVEKKNSDLRIVFNEKDALEKSKKWFLQLWKENKKDFERRMKLWKEKCYTISAYLKKDLIAVHIAMHEKDTVYYFGCWWNREYKNRSIPTFLLNLDIENSIKKKIKYYDLERGDEHYKKKWGVIEKPTKYYAIMKKDMAEDIGVKKYAKI